MSGIFGVFASMMLPLIDRDRDACMIDMRFTMAGFTTICFPTKPGGNHHIHFIIHFLGFELERSHTSQAVYGRSFL